MSDAQANEYSGERRGSRYILKQTVVLRSSDVDKILAASQRVGDLASVGVSLCPAASMARAAADRRSFFRAEQAQAADDRRGDGARPRGGRPVCPRLPQLARRDPPG